ncbi:hypothetical protein GCM10017750_00480 [Streptomyces racemochromogenes]
MHALGVYAGLGRPYTPGDVSELLRHADLRLSFPPLGRGPLPTQERAPTGSNTGVWVAGPSHP